MNRYVIYGLAILLITQAGCESYARYTIDEKPTIKIDTGLLGIWKAIEDTDKADYVIVQSYNDVHHKRDGIEFYPGTLEEQQYKNYDYYVTRMDHHGRNPHYQQFTAFLSRIGSSMFLNTYYMYTPYEEGRGFITEQEEEGYFFVRLNVNETHTILTTALVADTTLRYLTRSEEVRGRIAYNINRPSFYSDTLHFYKISSYHYSLNASIAIANK